MSFSPDQRILTAKQKLVFVLDQMGKSPTQISEQTGLRLSRVSNIKQRLKSLGFPVAVYRRKSTRNELRQHRAKTWTEPVITRSEHEPDDDEQPDADEPAFTDIKRCRCGLILPCYHGSNDEIILASSNAGAAADEGDSEDIGYRTSQYDSDRSRKARKLARANTARLSATKVRAGLDGKVHVP